VTIKADGTRQLSSEDYGAYALSGWHAVLPNFFTSSPHLNRVTELRLKVSSAARSSI
jgi:hypothetical protein